MQIVLEASEDYIHSRHAATGLEEAALTDETTPSTSEATPTNLDNLQLSPIIEELK